MDLKKQIGAAVRSAREDQGMTREELAVKAKVSHGTVTSIEQGRYAPQLDNLLNVAHVLDMDLNVLLGLGTPKTAAPAARGRFRERMRPARKKAVGDETTPGDASNRCLTHTPVDLRKPVAAMA